MVVTGSGRKVFDLIIRYVAEAVTEFSTEFFQGMVDRMTLSMYKYGKVSDAYPSRINALDSLQKRIEKYRDTGNTEFLMDVANFAMIEFMHPSLPNTFYTPTDSDQ